LGIHGLLLAMRFLCITALPHVAGSWSSHRKNTRLYQGLTQELQCEINERLLRFGVPVCNEQRHRVFQQPVRRFHKRVGAITQITVTIPAGASSGAVKITANNSQVSSQDFTIEQCLLGQPVENLESLLYSIRQD
jgi:hypothetical protein